MAFAIRNLSVLAYANGFTLWHYKSGKDRLSTVSSSNYFADASDMLTGGDMVMITAADGGTVRMIASADVDFVSTVPMSSYHPAEVAAA